ncbi:MAG: PAC2 family protein [Candidatus Omnitrophica bacterium]|nr:PAC2 family protein [Candidatus Omnitrophota bacterium]
MIKEIINPKLKKPIFIPVWPGMGEVAYRTALFLREALDFKMFAKLEATGFFKPAGVIVDKGILSIPNMPAGFFYYFKSSHHPHILLFIGETQPPLEYGIDLSRVIIEFAKKHDAEFIVTFAAKPEPIDHKTDPQVWITVTHRSVLEQFKRFNLKVLNEGQISGLNGLIIGEAKNQNMKGICLLAEIPFYTVQIENPRANINILKILDSYLNLNLNLNPLIERASIIEAEIDKLINYLKGEGDTPPPLSEEDIDKIRKDLSAYTKLPQSVREKIEKYFKEAQKDISKARILKEELDHWNVYKEYEDRFLDLFKRDKKEEIH